MSPTWRDGKWRLKFTSHDRGEPPHIHIGLEQRMAKILMDGSVAYNHGLRDDELREAVRYVLDHAEELRRRWDEFWAKA